MQKRKSFPPPRSSRPLNSVIIRKVRAPRREGNDCGAVRQPSAEGVVPREFPVIRRDPGAPCLDPSRQREPLNSGGPVSSSMRSSLGFPRVLGDFQFYFRLEFKRRRFGAVFSRVSD